LRGAAGDDAISFSSKDCFALLAMTRYPPFSEPLRLLSLLMQRANDLWQQVISFENLYHAAYRVLRGKRDQRRAADFFLHLEGHLLQLQRELRS
jgi:hypothetical protein